MPTPASSSPIVKAFSSDVSVAEGERAVTAVITTNAVDRDGEVVIPQGIDAKQYQDNPVLFFNHAWCEYGVEPTDKLPVGKCVAVKRDGDQLVAKFQFASRPATHPADEEWLPDTLLSLYQQGVMNGFSIGFIPTETRPATDKDVTKFGAGVRRVISKCKLFEVSCVPLACNPEAVTLAISKGLLTQERADRLFVKSLPASVTPPPAAPAAPDAAPAAPPVTPASVSLAGATKHLKYFVGLDLAKEPEPAVKSADEQLAEEISKRRGRLYYV